MALISILYKIKLYDHARLGGGIAHIQYLTIGMHLFILMTN